MEHRQEHRHCFCSSSLSGTFIHVGRIKNKTCYNKKQLKCFSRDNSSTQNVSSNEKYDKVIETFYAITLEKQQKCSNRAVKNEFHPKKC